MPDIRTQPTIYEINTPIFLAELSQLQKQRVTLATVPHKYWDELAEQGIDAVWFMGVWQRSPIARDLATGEPWLRHALPDIQQEDLLGSAYSIQDYVIDGSLGGNDALAEARAQLEKRGIGIILDYVPNHVAIDHAWATEHPEYLLLGSEAELFAHPEAFFEMNGKVFAKAKDPNFAPWSDVLQINAFSQALRQEVTQTLQHLATMCDGLRCDMAMLMMNDVFKQTWGERVGDVPDEDYWPEIISAVRQVRPDFLFLAEVYWDKEKDLLKQGFDLCYDKHLYDHLLESPAPVIKQYVEKPRQYQNHLLRFIENHDEKRAASVYSFDKHVAAAVVMATLPGAHLYHDGQREGRQLHVPVHLGRRVDEVPNDIMKLFYRKLWKFVSSESLYTHHWKQVKVITGLMHKESDQILAWVWTNKYSRFLICVNYSPKPAHGHVDLVTAKAHSAIQLTGGPLLLTHVLNDGYLKLQPWQHVIIELSK